MALSLKVHHYRTTKTNKNVLTKSTPYIRLKHGEDPPIFIQDGRYWYENGEEVKVPPKWVEAELKKISSLAKSEVGLGDSSSI